MGFLTLSLLVTLSMLVEAELSGCAQLAAATFDHGVNVYSGTINPYACISTSVTRNTIRLTV